MSNPATIAERLAALGLEYRKDNKTAADGRYSVYEGGKHVARVSAKEAVFLLEDLGG
jgi:hypothetical protein